MHAKIITFFLLLHQGASSKVEVPECRIIHDKYNNQQSWSRNFIQGEAWPHRRVPYLFQPGFTSSQLAEIKSAMKEIEKHTCVKWVPRMRELNYVYIKHNERGCFATLGYASYRGRHELNLQKPGYGSCMIKGIIIHEMLHILGFSHEHTRPDRDEYIKVMWANIKRSSIDNFFRAGYINAVRLPPKCDMYSGAKSFDNCYSGFRTETFGFEYDFGSIMHYDTKAHSINGKHTIVPQVKVPSTIHIGNRKRMTKLDIAKVKAKYRCDGFTWSTTLKTTTTTTTSTTTTTTSTTPTPIVIKCINTSKDCASLKSQCKDINVRIKCRKTCGACKGCKNLVGYCQGYQKFCEYNVVVQEYCARTCKLCYKK